MSGQQVRFTGFEPPGIRLELRDDTLRAELWPGLGGSVARLQAHTRGAWVDVLRPTPAQERYSPMDLACWPMLPYGGRLREGELPHAGRVHRLPPNHPEQPLPLHGTGWIRPWRVERSSARAAELVLEAPGDADWPWAFEARQRVSLADGALQVLVELRNLATEPMPCGLGLHPYLRRPAGSVLQAPVDSVWRADAQVLPVERLPLPAQWSLPTGCALDDVALDNCFDGLRGEATLTWPDGARVRVGADAAARCLVVYNPPGQEFTCVEPSTHLPDAPHLPAATPLAVLQPGAELALRAWIRFLPAG